MGLIDSVIWLVDGSVDGSVGSVDESVDEDELVEVNLSV